MPNFHSLKPPTSGTPISRKNGQLVVPADPIIPFIEGDGTGPDIWRASVRVFDAAVEKAFGGKRRLAWFEVLAGEKAKNGTGEWLPIDTVEAVKAYKVAIKGPFARARTRRGQKVEISMLDAMAALLTYQAGTYVGTGQRPARRGNAHPSIVPYEVFKAADAYLTLGVANNALWAKCCAALDRPELATDPRFDTEARRVTNRDVLIPLLNE